MFGCLSEHTFDYLMSEISFTLCSKLRPMGQIQTMEPYQAPHGASGGVRIGGVVHRLNSGAPPKY